MSDLLRFNQGNAPLPFGGAARLRPHGSADWMDTELARALGLYGDGSGAFRFARGQAGVMSYGNGGHALVCAPSRSGKGVGFVIPNLLLWEGSAFCIDPKGELAHFTAEHRRKRQKVYVLDPCKVSGQPGVRFNPLSWLDRSYDLDRDLRVIVQALTPDTSGNASFWNNAARELIAGLLMYQISQSHEEVTLGRTYELLNLPQAQWEKLLGAMARCDGGSASLNTKVRRAARWFDSLHEEHQQYHRGTAQYHLAWLGVSAAREMVSATDFDIRELKDDRATVYVCIPGIDSETYEGFTRVLTALAIKAQSSELEDPADGKPPTLLMLDEFATTVGRLRVFDDAYTNIAGYGGRFAIVLQTIDQLQSLFPERKGNQSWKTIYENAGLRLFFNARSKTAEFVSDELGMTTVDQIAPVGGPRQVQSKLHFPDQVAFPKDEQGRPVLDAVFAFVEGYPPIRARRLCYYRDPEFRGLYNPVTKIPTHRPEGLTEYQLARSGYGAGVDASDNPFVAHRDELPEPPKLSADEQNAYAHVGGWGEF